MDITYAEYHRLVVEACVALTSEDCRIFWDTQCSFETEYEEQIPPDEVAQEALEAL